MTPAVVHLSPSQAAAAAAGRLAVPAAAATAPSTAAPSHGARARQKVSLKLIHTATPDTTTLPRLPVDRRRDAGQAGSSAQPPDRPHAVTLYATQNVNTRRAV